MTHLLICCMQTKIGLCLQHMLNRNLHVVIIGYWHCLYYSFLPRFLRFAFTCVELSATAFTTALETWITFIVSVKNLPFLCMKSNCVFISSLKRWQLSCLRGVLALIYYHTKHNCSEWFSRQNQFPTDVVKMWHMLTGSQCRVSHRLQKFSDLLKPKEVIVD